MAEELVRRQHEADLLSTVPHVGKQTVKSLRCSFWSGNRRLEDVRADAARGNNEIRRAKT
ncbi:hypothetical protein [Microbacterium aurantiacum]|uniref:hypothetical protein n=1 Tax=Microbacterium aurantiacum TaxID=162393 RepID=UPI000C80B98D|nr:hypothetical protein [Microbacterium aurantiacum]